MFVFFCCDRLCCNNTSISNNTYNNELYLSILLLCCNVHAAILSTAWYCVNLLIAFVELLIAFAYRTVEMTNRWPMEY